MDMQQNFACELQRKVDLQQNNDGGLSTKENLQQIQDDLQHPTLCLVLAKERGRPGTPHLQHLSLDLQPNTADSQHIQR